MRPIHLASLDKTRPVLVLTRTRARAGRSKVTVAPITSTIRGLLTELPVGREHGLDHASVVDCDNILTIYVSDLGRQIGYLRPSEEQELTVALVNAFDLQVEELP